MALAVQSKGAGTITQAAASASSPSKRKLRSKEPSIEQLVETGNTSPYSCLCSADTARLVGTALQLLVDQASSLRFLAAYPLILLPNNYAAG